MLHTAAQIITMSSAQCNKEIGSSCFKSLNCFNRPIAFSIYIRLLAISYVFCTSSIGIWSWPRFPGGMITSTPRSKASSRIGNPRSAKMASPL